MRFIRDGEGGGGFGRGSGGRETILLLSRSLQSAWKREAEISQSLRPTGFFNKDTMRFVARDLRI